MREFREVRFRGSGDPADQAPYIGIARTLLGQLKNLMRFQGLKQLIMHRRLADGTLITVGSIHGQDFVRIDPVRERVAEAEPEETSYIFICTPQPENNQQAAFDVVNGQWIGETGLELQYGNVDWRGWGADDVLSWSGLSGRYFGSDSVFDPAFGTSLYHQGKLLSRTPYRCLGAAIQYDSSGKKWLVVVGKSNFVERVHARQWDGKSYDLHWSSYDPVTNPEGWRELGLHDLGEVPGGSVARPYFFNASGTEAQCALGANSSIYHRIKISVNVNTLTAAWQVIEEPYTGLREFHTVIDQDLDIGTDGHRYDGGMAWVEMYPGGGYASSLSEGVETAFQRMVEDAESEGLILLSSEGYSITGDGVNYFGAAAGHTADFYYPPLNQTTSGHSVATQYNFTWAQRKKNDSPEVKTSFHTLHGISGGALYAVDYQGDTEVVLRIDAQMAGGDLHHERTRTWDRLIGATSATLFESVSDINTHHPGIIPPEMVTDRTTDRRSSIVNRNHAFVVSGGGVTLPIYRVTEDISSQRQIDWEKTHSAGERFTTDTFSTTGSRVQEYVYMAWADFRIPAMLYQHYTIEEVFSGQLMTTRLSERWILSVKGSEIVLAEGTPKEDQDPAPQSLGTLAEWDNLIITIPAQVPRLDEVVSVASTPQYILGSLYLHNQYDFAQNQPLNFLYDGNLIDPLALINWAVQPDYSQPALGRLGVY